MYRIWNGFRLDLDFMSTAGVSFRRTLLIAAGALALTLAGCGGAGGPESATGASTESVDEDFTFPAEAALLPLTITSLQPGSDATKLYYTINFTGAPSRIQLFLDTDRDASTGYPINGIGASHLVEIGAGYRNLYSYSGSGGAWAWTLLRKVTYTKATKAVTVTIAKTDVGSPNGIDLIAGLSNSAATVYSPKVSQVLGTGADTAAPSVPTGLIGTAVSGSQINLSWSASTDNVGVTGYTVYLNDAQLATTTATSFSHTGLTAGSTYNYRVSAFDAVPNHSAWTATPVAVTTPAAPDTAAPSVPAGLIGAAVSGSQINLSWSASTDNVGVTGYIVYLNDAQLATTTATSFSHTGLTAGSTYNYRVSAFDAVPNHSAWTATPVAVTTPAAPGDPGTVMFNCTFLNLPTNCGFKVQEKVAGRASIVGIGRDGGTALRLHTEPGDNNVASSGAMERTDVYLAHAGGAPIMFNEGEEHWWAHSMMLPDDFALPTWQMYVLFDFHNSGASGQANFHVQLGGPGNENGDMIFRGYGGSSGGEFRATVGRPQKNVWYDFVYHVKWSSGSDGFFRAWVNGVKKLDHSGPTLYPGQGSYLKLANYHTPVCDPYPGCTGPASSVIHDRVIRGTSPLAVSLGPLEGVLELVNGVLTPVPGF
jgi:chitodextrinase